MNEPVKLDGGRIQLYQGDCQTILPTLAAGSVDAVVTDPPYGLSFMGKAWDHGVPGVDFWRAVLARVKPGTHLLAFGGTRTFHRLACALEDAGWEIRDTIMWVYGSGFPKSLDVSKAIDKAAGAEREGTIPNPYAARRPGPVAETNIPGAEYGFGTNHLLTAPATAAAAKWQGWGTALKPAWEPILVCRKPLAGTVAENVLAHGTGGINVDGCRIAVDPAIDDMARHVERKPRITQTWREGSGFKNEHNELTGVLPSGRWPANLCHDGSEEVLAGFPHNAGDNGTHMRGKKSTPGSGQGIFAGGAKSDANCYTDSGSAARFFYCSKASRGERNEGLVDPGARRKRNDTTGGKYAEAPNPLGSNTHPTVKPLALMRWLVRLVTPPGGTVLDPFLGSGSTLKAAVCEGMGGIGIEIDPGYFEIARRRIEEELRLRDGRGPVLEKGNLNT